MANQQTNAVQPGALPDRGQRTNSAGRLYFRCREKSFFCIWPRWQGNRYNNGEAERGGSVDIKKPHTAPDMGEQARPVIKIRLWHMYLGIFAISFSAIWGFCDIVAHLYRALGY